MRRRPVFVSPTPAHHALGMSRSTEPRPPVFGVLLADARCDFTVRRVLREPVEEGMSVQPEEGSWQWPRNADAVAGAAVWPRRTVEG